MKLPAMSEKVLIPVLLAKLDKLYDGQASKLYVRHDLMNWTQNETSSGTYSHKMNADLIKTMAEPMEDTVFFAGEHLSVEYVGYVHGAAITGRQAALQAMGYPDSKETEDCGLNLTCVIQ